MIPDVPTHWGCPSQAQVVIARADLGSSEDLENEGTSPGTAPVLSGWASRVLRLGRGAQWLTGSPARLRPAHPGFPVVLVLLLLFLALLLQGIALLKAVKSDVLDTHHFLSLDHPMCSRIVLIAAARIRSKLEYGNKA